MSTVPVAPLDEEETIVAPPAMAVPEHLHAYLWMLAGAVAFAFMGTLTHRAGQDLDWRLVALTRAGLALVFASTLAVRNKSRLIVLGSPTVWMRSLAGSTSLLCTFYALTQLPTAECLTLTNMFPLWVVLLSWPMLGQLPSLASTLAAALAVAGVAVMGMGEIVPKTTGWTPAYLVALFASVTSAIAMIGLHRLRHLAPTAIVAHFSGVGVIFCLGSIFAPGVAAIHINTVTPVTVLSLLGVGLMATAGQLSITRAFAAGPPDKVSVVALTQVVFALGLDLAIWGHPFHVAKFVGMLLILLPTAWVMTRRKRSREQ